MASCQSDLINCNEILSIQELEEIVCKTINVDNVNVIKYEITADPSVFGYLGEYFRLAVYVESKASKSLQVFKYFLKSLPINDEAQRKYIESYGMFTKEGRLYKELLSKLGGADFNCKWRPECYLVRSDLFVLEDLNLLGYAHLKHRTAFQTPHVECALNTIAKLHGASISYDDNSLKPSTIGSEFNDILIETSIGVNNIWHLVGLEAVKSIAPLTPNFNKYKDWSSKKFDELIAPIYEMTLKSKKFRNVLCHRDLWQNNLVFKFKRNANHEIDYSQPTDCVLIDFQTCRYLPPIIDVIGLISVSTRLAHRKQFYPHYIQFYYNALTKELARYNIEAAKVLSWDEFRNSLKELEMVVLVINCVCRPLTMLSSEILLSLKTQNPERFMRTMHVNRHEFILEHMEKDAEYKEIVIESYGELLDYMFGLTEQCSAMG